MATALNAEVLLITLLVPLFCEAKPSGEKITLDKACVKKGFCFDMHPMYPQEKVDGVIHKMNMSNFMSWKTASISDQDLDNNNDCAVYRQQGPVYEIIDTNDDVRIVVQSEQYLKQIIEVEQCRYPGRLVRPSLHFSQQMVLHYNLYCDETNLDVQFLVLNTDWTGIEVVKSKYGIPVACNCRQTM